MTACGDCGRADHTVLRGTCCRCRHERLARRFGGDYSVEPEGRTPFGNELYRIRRRPNGPGFPLRTSELVDLPGPAPFGGRADLADDGSVRVEVYRD